MTSPHMKRFCGDSSLESDLSSIEKENGEDFFPKSSSESEQEEVDASVPTKAPAFVTTRRRKQNKPSKSTSIVEIKKLQRSIG